jgi:hypothetical protein
MGQMLGALGQAMAQGQQAGAAAIPWQSLAQALPLNAVGWTAQGQAKGESAQMMGISVSTARLQLTQGAMKGRVEIVDTSMNPMLAMPFNMARTMRIDSSEERMGPINFGTYPGTQVFRKTSGQAEVMVLVANRLLVTVTVDGASAEQPAVSLAQQVNYPLLAQHAMGAQPAQP